MPDTQTIAGVASTAQDADFELFRKRAYAIAGVDLTGYKAPQMQRRLTALLAKVQVTSFAEYAKMLERDATRRQEFKDFVTINVSEFFRDGDRFSDLERRIIPELVATTPRGLRVWSAGCSIGAEPYSLSMILQEKAPGRSHAIVGTDIDETILARARAGTDYVLGDIRNVGRDRQGRWFTRNLAGRFDVVPSAKGGVTYQKHDLLRDTQPGGPFDLILCRNVVIYFTEEAKERIYRGFAQALRPGGVLFVGGTEAIMHPQTHGLDVYGPGFYRRRV